MLERFGASFNSGAISAQKSTMHFPHYRLAGGRMTVIQDLENQPRIVPLESEWAYTKTDSLEFVGWSLDKVHVNLYFTRHRSDNTPIASFKALYILPKEEGHWGIKMRSSFAP